ncbi:MAG: hypothetical protein ACRD8U_02230 [Pyrinomonadaceae bacterium]
MVKFETDEAVHALGSIDSINGLACLLGLLSGERIDAEKFLPNAKDAVDEILKRVRDVGPDKLEMSYEEFNELLLIFNQYRVGRHFFEFFFLQNETKCGEARTSISFRQLPSGVTRFRGFALLCYGNFRFAYRELIGIDDWSEFRRKLKPWNYDSEEQEKNLKSRKEPLLKLLDTGDHIPAEQVQWLGYLTGGRLTNDLVLLNIISGKIDEQSVDEVLARINDKKLAIKIKKQWDDVTDQVVDKWRNTISDLKQACGMIMTDAVQAQAKGTRNTLKYLTWDYMDVYVATSMRHEWEFRETYVFVREVFQERLCKRDGLQLRWFDPTQSYDDNQNDKGLLEGLMLKRAKCCVYMAQESDTLGKDSELAATLAQGKPVIAYVREIRNKDLPAEVDQMKRRPLRYFRQRLTFHLSDAFFEKPDNREKICDTLEHLNESLGARSFRNIIEDYLRLLYDFDEGRTFDLISDEEQRYREMHREKFAELEKFMAAVESVAANNRAETIQLRHPLSMQVNLQTGVSNGVLVVRNYDMCAQLVKEIVTRSLHFKITDEMDDSNPNPKKLATFLREEKTNSRFRIVTENDCLTNSFWNFYPSMDRRLGSNYADAHS